MSLAAPYSDWSSAVAWCGSLYGWGWRAHGASELGWGSFLLLPLVMLGHAVAGGGWILLTLPLAGFVAYRALHFIRGDGSLGELGILASLSLLVCLPASRGPSGFEVLILVGVALMLAAYLRRSEEGRR